MSRILITGGAGFIGSHTADALLEKGHHVRVLDILDPQIHGDKDQPPAYLDRRVEFMKGDVRDRAAVEKALEGVAAVFHFAACTGVGQSMYEIHQYVDVNISGTAMLLDVLANRDHSVRKVILSSSRAVYGEGEYRCGKCGIVHPGIREDRRLKEHLWEMLCPSCGEGVEAIPTTEGAPRNPVSIYGITKMVQEDLIRSFSAAYGLPSVILRYFNVYGTRQALNNPYTGIAAIFTARVLSGRGIPIYEDGKPLRDFVHVRDVVRANLLALENPGADNGTFNVGSGRVVTVEELAREIRKTLSGDVPLEYTGRFRKGDIRACYADLSRSAEGLGYRSEVSIEEGVLDLVAWAKGESPVDLSEKAEEELRNKKLMVE